MVQSIVLTGLAIGCIYALIGITYNVMYSASRVFSFTAGTLGMLGGVLGSLFIARMGLAAGDRLRAGAGRRHRVRTGHRDRGRAAGAEKPRSASLRAVDAGAGADGAAVHRDRVGHRGAAVSAADRSFRAAISISSSGCRCWPAPSSSSASNCCIGVRWSAAPFSRSPRTLTPRGRSGCRSAACGWRATRSPA